MNISIHIVKGGFILSTSSDEGYEQEVFTSLSKLLKVVKTTLEPVDDLDEVGQPKAE